MADGTLGPNTASAIQEPDDVASAIQLAQAPGQPIGTISTASGAIHVRHVDGREEELSTGGNVYANDIIRTEPDGAVQIRFVDGTEFLLGGNAELTIDNLIYDPSGSDNAMNMLVAGAFVFVSGAIAGAPGEGMRIETPAGAIGIRGTSVAGRVSETEHGLLLALLRDPTGHIGHVVVFNDAGSVDLDELFEATVLRDRQTPPQTPFQLTLEQIQQLFGSMLQMDRNLDLQNESYERRTELENILPSGGPYHNGGINAAFVGALFGMLLEPGSQPFRGGFFRNIGDTTSGGVLNPLGASTLPNFGPPGQPEQPPQHDHDTFFAQDRDTIVGTPEADTLIGGPRNELIIGQGGADSIEGASGNDTVDAGPGNDTALGNDGNDILVGGTGDDSLAGDNGNDSIVGSPGADRLDGGAGDDTVQGGGDGDSITGGDGNDILLGGDILDDAGGGDGEEALLLAAAAATRELGTGGNALVNGLGGPAGFGEGVLPPNDDGSTGFIDVTSVFPTGMNFFGTPYNGFYINNNGNITFGSPLSTFTPFSLTGSTGNPMIAPFFADVDTNGAHALPPTPGGTSTGANAVYYDLDPQTGTIVITWDDVGYFASHTDKLNAFQLVIQNTGGSNFSFEFRYENIDWTTGDASGGSGGLGGTVARAGWNSGNGSDFFELPQSGNQAEMLGLETTSNPGTDPDGNWVFNVVGGQVVSGDGADIINGGNGDDSILGGDGNDTLLGAADNDTMDGGNDADLLSGGDGNDLLNGGGHDSATGADTLLGEAGDDRLVFNDADNVYDGGDGIDALQLSESVDFIQLPAGNYQSIEILDLRPAGGQTVTLNADDILDLATGNSTGESVSGHPIELVVRGTAADAVDLSTTSFAIVASGVNLSAPYGGGSTTYNIYQEANGNDVAIESAVTVHTAQTTT